MTGCLNKSYKNQTELTGHTAGLKHLWDAAMLRQLPESTHLREHRSVTRAARLSLEVVGGSPDGHRQERQLAQVADSTVP